MTTLHLGVVDIAYTGEQGATTTGEVAGYLEDQFHVMRVFLELHEEEIGNFLADAMAGEIETLMQGGRPRIFGTESSTRLGSREITGYSVNSRIEEAFRDYLNSREWQTVSGVYVEAAQTGVTSRKKAGKQTQGRAEFVDTGLYGASFRAWID